MNIFSNPYKDTETWAAAGRNSAMGHWRLLLSLYGFPFMMINLQMQYARSLSSFFPINGDSANNMTKINISGAP